MKLNEPFRHLMPSLSAIDFGNLKADIKANGLEHAIAVDEERNILDGHHRYRVCLELGIQPMTMTIPDLGSDHEKHAWIYRVNLNRRSLTAAEKKALAQKQKATALALLVVGHGVREVARMVGKAHSTVIEWQRGSGGRIDQSTQLTNITQHKHLSSDVEAGVVVEGLKVTDKEQKAIAQEQKVIALQMLGEGKSLSSVAQTLGRPLSTIQLWRNRPEQKAGRDHLKVNDTEVKRLWDEGTDRSGIAKTLGISVGAVSSSFKRLGIGRGGRTAKNPLINYLERATAEADIWTDCASPILATAMKATPRQTVELAVELGRLSRAALQLKRRLEEAARKRDPNGNEEAREAEGEGYRH